MTRIEATAALILLLVSTAAFPVPTKTYSTCALDAHEDSSLTPVASVDQAVAVPISKPWTLTAGAEYAAPADGTFLSDPRRMGGRLGVTHIFPNGLYSETQIGVVSWFQDAGIDATSVFAEAAINAEGALWYLAFRDRWLFNADSLVSILTVHGKWYPAPFIRSEAKTSLAMESGLGLSPSARAEVSFAPISTIPFLFFGGGAGIESYAVADSAGGGRGVETTALGIVSLIFDSGRSLRLSAERHFGDRNDDLWKLEAYFVLVFGS
jgi:hypothetical protein